MALPYTASSRPIWPNASYHHGILWEPLFDRIVWQCTHLHKKSSTAMQCAKMEWTRRDRQQQPAGRDAAAVPEETPAMAEETTTTTPAAGAATATPAPKGKSKPAAKPAATPAAKPAAAAPATVTRSRQGTGAKKGEIVRIVRRKNEEKDGKESWHIWQKDSNRNVVPTRFESEAAATAHARREGWVVANSKGEVAK